MNDYVLDTSALYTNSHATVARLSLAREKDTLDREA